MYRKVYLSSSVGKDLAQLGVLAHNSSNRDASETPSRDTPPRDKLIRAAKELAGLLGSPVLHFIRLKSASLSSRKSGKRYEY
jgi:hypothetical protein